MSDVSLKDWQSQVDWMRANGVVSAKWAHSGFKGTGDLVLVECITGPAPEATPVAESAEDMEKRHEREAKERQEMEDMRDYGAS